MEQAVIRRDAGRLASPQVRTINVPVVRREEYERTVGREHMIVVELGDADDGHAIEKAVVQVEAPKRTGAIKHKRGIVARPVRSLEKDIATGEDEFVRAGLHGRDPDLAALPGSQNA